MSGRKFKSFILGVFTIVVMLVVALGIVYVVKIVMERSNSTIQVENPVETTSKGNREDYKHLIGTEGYKYVLIKTDESRQQHYVSKVCKATGEIISTTWVDFNKVDLGQIVN